MCEDLKGHFAEESVGTGGEGLKCGTLPLPRGCQHRATKWNWNSWETTDSLKRRGMASGLWWMRFLRGIAMGNGENSAVRVNVWTLSWCTLRPKPKWCTVPPHLPVDHYFPFLFVPSFRLCFEHYLFTLPASMNPRGKEGGADQGHRTDSPWVLHLRLLASAQTWPSPHSYRGFQSSLAVSFRLNVMGESWKGLSYSYKGSGGVTDGVKDNKNLVKVIYIYNQHYFSDATMSEVYPGNFPKLVWKWIGSFAILV